MVLTVYKYNGVWIRTPGGLLAGHTNCCCDQNPPTDCCCASIVDATEIRVDIAGTISGTGILTLSAGSPAYCIEWSALVSMSGGGNCGGDVINLNITLRCVVGSTGIDGLEIDISGSSGTCAASVVGGIDLAASQCNPFHAEFTGRLDEILPGGCSCGDGTTFTLTFTLP